MNANYIRATKENYCQAVATTTFNVQQRQRLTCTIYVPYNICWLPELYDVRRIQGRSKYNQHHCHTTQLWWNIIIFRSEFRNSLQRKYIICVKKTQIEVQKLKLRNRNETNDDGSSSILRNHKSCDTYVWELYLNLTLFSKSVITGDTQCKGSSLTYVSIST